MGLVTSDPDHLALERARDDIGALLSEFGHQTSRTQREQIVQTAIFSWLRYRFVEWSRNRAISGIGIPDAYTLGAAETILPIIAERHFPWTKPVGDWSKEEVVTLFAMVFEAVNEQQARTLEDPTIQWTEVVNA